MKCLWNEFLAIVPPQMRQNVDNLGKETLQELRLRLAHPPELVCCDGSHCRTLFEGQEMIYGYARVSTLDQNLDRQKDALRAYGVERIFCEKVSGAKKSRPELDKMLAIAEKRHDIKKEHRSAMQHFIERTKLKYADEVTLSRALEGRQEM